MKITIKLLFKIFIILLFLMWSYPIIWMVLASLKNNPDYLKNVLSLPKAFHFENYIKAYQRANLGYHALLSVFYTITTLVLVMGLSSLAAYGINFSKTFLSKTSFSIFLIGMIFPGQSFLIGMFVNMKITHILDSPLAVILALTAVNMPLSVLLIKAAFSKIPHSLYESASLEGASSFYIFYKIYLPLAKPMLSTVSIFVLLGAWNEFLYPYVLISDIKYKPLTNSLYVFATKYAADHVTRMAALVLIALPMFFIYGIFQKQIQNSLMEGAVK